MASSNNTGVADKHHAMHSPSSSEDNLHLKYEPLSPSRTSMDSPVGPVDESKDGLNSMDIKRYALKWRQHQSTVVAEVGSLYRDAALVDVTLACEDQQTYQAHKLVLSACSQYFQSLFSRHPAYQHPIIFLKDVRGEECEALLTFMYRGEVSVNQDQIPSIIRVAQSLQIRGLTQYEPHQSSRPSSPAFGDRGGSSSPSLSTGPPTKCVTPASEPHSPNPPPPLINPPIPPLGGMNSGSAISHHHDTSPIHQHSSSAPPTQPMHQDFPFPLLHHPRPPYDLGPSPASLLNLSEERTRQEDRAPSIGSSYPLRVKDLTGNSWDNNPVDVGAISPHPIGEGHPGPPYLPPHHFLSRILNPEPHLPARPGYGQSTFSIIDPIIRLATPSSDARIHKCHFCSRKFKRKDHLKTHVRIHTGERPYKCRVCHRGFIQSQQVKIHMKVHQREDASGLGSSSLLSSGSSGGASFSSLYPDISSHYSDPPSSDRSLRTSGNSNSEMDQSPDHHRHSLQHASNQNIAHDTDIELSPEMPDSEYDSKTDSTPRRYFARNLSSRASFLSAGGRRSPISPNNASPPPATSANHSMGGSSGRESPLNQLSRTKMNASPTEDKSCSAISMKESYHIGSNIKK